MRARLTRIGIGLLQLAGATLIVLVCVFWPKVLGGGKGLFALLGIAVMLVVFALGPFYAVFRPARKPPAPEEAAP
jgi:hypothetical protein